MIEIIAFDNFSKRKNSTKQPIDSDGTVMEVVLKGECSLVNPSFFISGTQGWNYIKAFGLYYFVDRVAYDINGAQYINCSIDVLASWKPSILNTSAFVKLSSTDYSQYLIDDRISQLTTRIKDRIVMASIFTFGWEDGCYVLSTANEVHGVCSYILTKENLEFIVNDLIEVSPTEIDNWQELFGDAMGSIIGVRYIPIEYSWFPSAFTEDVVLGGYNTGIPGILYDGHIGQVRSIHIPWKYSDFRRCSEFTRFLLCLPFIGPVELKPESIIDQESIYIQMEGSCVTGHIGYGIYVDSSPSKKLIATYNGNFGRQIPVAQGQVDLNGILHSGVVAGGAWVGAALGASQGAALAAIGGATINAIVSANEQDYTIVGGFAGGYSEVILNDYELITFVKQTQTDPSSLTELYGRPCMKVRKIEGLSGYVQTIGFAIDIPAVSEIRDLINSAMDRGVYIE